MSKEKEHDLGGRRERAWVTLRPCQESLDYGARMWRCLPSSRKMVLRAGERGKAKVCLFLPQRQNDRPQLGPQEGQQASGTRRAAGK